MFLVSSLSYATAISDYAAKHPEFHVIGTWPLDGGRYCECEQCKDPETIFKAAMHVAEKVKLVRPDIIVEHLAYVDLATSQNGENSLQFCAPQFL